MFTQKILDNSTPTIVAIGILHFQSPLYELETYMRGMYVYDLNTNKQMKLTGILDDSLVGIRSGMDFLVDATGPDHATGTKVHRLSTTENAGNG